MVTPEAVAGLAEGGSARVFLLKQTNKSPFAALLYNDKNLHLAVH